jgi:hypothetical protein
VVTKTEVLKKMLKTCCVLMLSLTFCSTKSSAQHYEMYNTEHDDLPYYFGISLGYNTSFLHLANSARFIKTDSTLSANSINSSGLNIGLSGTLRLSNRFELRVNPQIIVGGSEIVSFLNYDYNADTVSRFQLAMPTTLLSMPIHVKFNSDRIVNFKMYLFAGAKYDFDLSANSNKRKYNTIQLQTSDFGLELGIGCNFYLPVGIISPELKISNGYLNKLKSEQTTALGNVFEKIQSRMIVFSIFLHD